MGCFIITLDSDPKDNNLIKHFMERLNLNENGNKDGVDFDSNYGDDDGHVSTVQ